MPHRITALIPGIAIAIGLFTVFATKILSLKFRRTLANYVLVICFGTVLGHAVYAAIATRQNLERAEVARVANQPSVVVREATAALRVDPNSAEAYAKRAVGYAIAGDCKHALIDVGNALAISTGLADAYLVRANCSSRSGDAATAIADFTRAIDRDSRSYAAYAGRAQQFWAIGDYTGALKDIDQALKLAPDNASLLLVRANITYQSNKESALADLRRVLSMRAPDTIRALAFMRQAAILEEIPGKESSALGSADEAVKLAPTLAEVYIERGNAFRALRMYPNALDDYAKALAIDPSSVLAYVDRANIYIG